MSPATRWMLSGTQRLRQAGVLGAVVLAAALGGAAQAEDGLGGAFGWMAPTIQPLTVGANASVTRDLPASTHGQDASVGMTTTRGGLRFQPWHDDHQEVQASATAVVTHVQTDAIFPDGRPLPDHLYDLRVGDMYRRITANQDIIGANLTFGSASEHPFHSSRDLTISASIFTRIPTSQTDAWLLFLAYSDERAVLNYIPFPGFAYLWNPTPAWRVMAGFPISGATWKATPAVSIDGLVSGFGTAHLVANWKPLPHLRSLRLHAGGDYGGDVYRNERDPDAQDRIIFRALRWSGGIAMDHGPGRTIDLSAGWAMDRQIFEGHKFLHNSDHIDIANGPFIAASAAWLW